MSNKQVIISIGREFGSGGHEIAQMLAKRFDLPLYDFNLLREIAGQKNVNAGNLEPYDEVPKKGFTSKTVRGFNNSPQINIAYMQFDYLKEKADSGESFIVVGRCSEEVLKGHEGLITIFVTGDMDKKIERIKRVYGVVDDKEAKDIIAKQSKKRKAYHNFFCEGKWGDARNYDFVINSSKLGESVTVDIIEDYIKRRMQ